MPRIRNSNIGYASNGMNVDVDTTTYGYVSSSSVKSTSASFDASSTSASKINAGFNAMPTPSPSPTSSPTHKLALPSLPRFEHFLPPDSGPEGIKHQGQSQGRQKRKHIAMASPSHPRTNPDHIPRPRNAFILFRSHVLSQLSAQSQSRSHSASTAIHRSGGRGKRTKQEIPIQIPVQQQEASREIAKLWKNIDAETRAEFEERAREEKRRHKELYPDYRYAPRKVQQQQQQQSEAQAKAVRAPAPGRVKSVKTKRARDDDDYDDNDAPYVPGGRTKVHAHAQGRKASKKRAVAPLTPDTTPEPSPSPHLPDVGSTAFDEEEEEFDGGDAALEYPDPEDEENEEKDDASVLIDDIFQSTPSSERNLYELPHPEFCFPPNFDANNKNSYWEGASASRASDASMIDESSVPLLASSPYYTPTFTHVDRTRSDSSGASSRPHSKCTDAPCPSHFLAQIQEMADFDALLSSITATMDPSSSSSSSSSPFTFSFATLTNNKKESEDEEERDLIHRALRPFAPLWAFEERKRCRGVGGLDGVFTFPLEVGVNKAVPNTAEAREEGSDLESEMDLDATLAELVHLDMLTV